MPRPVFLIVGVVLAASRGSSAQTDGAARFYEPKQGYYHARGPAVTAEWAVERATVREDEAVIATLTVRGATNPRDIVRPDLRKIAAFADRFDPIEDVPGPPVAADAAAVSFAYRFRPRNTSVNRLPTLDFYYLRPGVPGDPFQLRRAKGIDLTVAPTPAKPPPPPIPLDAPDHLFAVTTGAALDPPLAPPGPWALVLIAALGPLLAGGWYGAWRRLFPDAAALSRRRRSAAGRRAVAAVRRAARSADPASGFAAAVVGYARARFALPPGAVTPGEVAAGLRAVGVADESAVAVENFLRRCDAARFAPAADGGSSLAADALALVARLEAAG